MKEFMGKLLNVWKAWSIRTKGGLVFTLVLIIFVISGVFSTPPTPSPRFSVPYNIEEDIQRGSTYHLICTVPSEQLSKDNYNQALLPASINKLSDEYQLAALDVAFDKNFNILQTYQVEDIHCKVMQLDKVLSGLSEHDPKSHKIDGYLLSIQGRMFSIVMSYKDGCGMGIDYDYNKGVYANVESLSGTLSRAKEKEIHTYLNKNLDKSNN